MALTGTLLADFSAFTNEAAKATAAVKTMETGADTAAAKLSKIGEGVNIKSTISDPMGTATTVATQFAESLGGRRRGGRRPDRQRRRARDGAVRAGVALGRGDREVRRPGRQDRHERAGALAPVECRRTSSAPTSGNSPTSCSSSNSAWARTARRSKRASPRWACRPPTLKAAGPGSVPRTRHRRPAGDRGPVGARRGGHRGARQRLSRRRARAQRSRRGAAADRRHRPVHRAAGQGRRGVRVPGQRARGTCQGARDRDRGRIDSGAVDLRRLAGDAARGVQPAARCGEDGDQPGQPGGGGVFAKASAALEAFGLKATALPPIRDPGRAGVRPRTRPPSRTSRSTCPRSTEALDAAKGSAEGARRPGQQDAEALKEWQKATDAINGATIGWQTTLDTIDGTVVEAIKYYLSAGVSQGDLAKAYGLTAQQVAAVKIALEDYATALQRDRRPREGRGRSAQRDHRGDDLKATNDRVARRVPEETGGRGERGRVPEGEPGRRAGAGRDPAGRDDDDDGVATAVGRRRSGSPTTTHFKRRQDRSSSSRASSTRTPPTMIAGRDVRRRARRGSW